MSKSRLLYLYPGAARMQRIADARTGDAPREFFYGLLGLEDRGYPIEIGDTHTDPQNAAGRALMSLEILRNRFAKVGWSRARVKALQDAFAQTDIAISFTDGFTIAMGLSAANLPPTTKRIGGFMGLCDLSERASPLLRSHVDRAIRSSLPGLNHLFFFGSADRHEAIARYGIDPAQTSVFAFGVDTDFWCPDNHLPQTEDILAVGSDPSRDYQTLLSANFNNHLRILTRLNVPIPPHQTNVDVTNGSLQSGALTDLALRDLYRTAQIIAVPLKDVWQPTGQSVTMQAMACGRPVVLTRGRGLWDPRILVDGENCLLVPPGDAAAWTRALERLSKDPELRTRIGAAARKTAVENFTLEHLNDSAEALVRHAQDDKAI